MCIHNYKHTFAHPCIIYGSVLLRIWYSLPRIISPLPTHRALSCLFFMTHFKHLLVFNSILKIEIYFIWHKTHHFKAHTLVAFGIFTMFCNHYHSLIPEHFHDPKRTSVPVSPPHPSTTTYLLSVSMDLPIQGILCHCNHTVWGLLCLASFI